MGEIIIFCFVFLMALKVNLEDTMYYLITLVKEKNVRFLIQTYLIYNQIHETFPLEQIVFNVTSTYQYNLTH